MKIYLIGMPGSGKTTIGRSLAEKLSVPFIDLDKEIEKREGKTISDIFSTDGEDHFRAIESRTLTEWSSRDDSFVLATGGGAPCFYNGIETMNATGLTIFLDVPIQELAQRTAKSDRPLLKTQTPGDLLIRLEALAKKRMAIYRKASIIATNPTVDSVLQKLQFRK
jgi:shikimate kinase